MCGGLSLQCVSGLVWWGGDGKGLRPCSWRRRPLTTAAQPSLTLSYSPPTSPLVMLLLIPGVAAPQRLTMLLRHHIDGKGDHPHRCPRGPRIRPSARQFCHLLRSHCPCPRPPGQQHPRQPSWFWWRLGFSASVTVLVDAVCIIKVLVVVTLDVVKTRSARGCHVVVICAAGPAALALSVCSHSSPETANGCVRLFAWERWDPELVRRAVSENKQHKGTLLPGRQ